MKNINVEITGKTPLLMNNPISMIEAQTTGMKQTTKKYDLKKEAEKLAYKMKNGTLYIPSEAIKGCLVNGAAYKKFGKFTAKPIVAGGVHIFPQQISLGVKKYELDIRTVVIQKNRVVKARPTLKKWKVKFQLQYDDTLISSPEDIKLILQDAGKRVGLLDFRPQKLGSFGMFEVTKWEELK